MPKKVKKRRHARNDAVRYDQPGKEKQRGKVIFKFLSRFAVIAALIGCTVSVISLQSNIAERQAELDTLNGQIESYQAENEDLSRILNSDDVDAFMEQLAREEYGYAYPDEQRFYDTSRN